MAQLAILKRKCTGCDACVKVCPFGAIDMIQGVAEINSACKMCGLCIKKCPAGAIVRLETKAASVDKSAWRDILVVAEVSQSKLHPVSLELIGKALDLARPVNYRVNALIIGDGLEGAAEELRHYGVDEIAVYDNPALAFFRADAFSACAEEYIRRLQPSVVLVGATALGRSLAPRLATRFRTGLTADCTQLQMRENTDLVQIRPAFGGNIMAQIITTRTRPQFATVRYRVMDAPERALKPSGEIVRFRLPKAARVSPVRHIGTVPTPPVESISEAQVLVVGGRGLKKAEDLSLVRELAALLGGDWAVSRPLVEKGWAPNDRQIGLSGRTVRPRLIITCGVSGAIQFTACMNQSEHIIAINSDPEASIFRVAHAVVVGDLYRIIPELIAKLKEGGA